MKFKQADLCRSSHLEKICGREWQGIWKHTSWEWEYGNTPWEWEIGMKESWSQMTSQIQKAWTELSDPLVQPPRFRELESEPQRGGMPCTECLGGTGILFSSLPTYLLMYPSLNYLPTYLFTYSCTTSFCKIFEDSLDPQSGGFLKISCCLPINNFK